MPEMLATIQYRASLWASPQIEAPMMRGGPGGKACWPEHGQLRGSVLIGMPWGLPMRPGYDACFSMLLDATLVRTLHLAGMVHAGSSPACN